MRFARAYWDGIHLHTFSFESKMFGENGWKSVVSECAAPFNSIMQPASK